MKYIFISIALLLIFSCRKSLSPNVIIDVNVQIHYIDSFDNELFSNGANGYIADSVRLYYVKNNSRQLVYTPTTANYIPDYPYGYILDSSMGKKYFTIFSNTYIVNDTAVTFIDLKSNIEDTLKCSFIQPNSNFQSIQCDKVWYNGKLMSRSFDVVK